MLSIQPNAGRGETPACDSQFKPGDVVTVRRLKGLERFPSEATVIAVVPPNFPAEYALADVMGKPRPAMIMAPRRVVRYILANEGDTTPYLATDQQLKPSGKPPVEIGSVHGTTAAVAPPNFLGLDMPGLAPPSSDGQGMFLLPPAKDACATCARKHAEDQPHDPNSLYWHTSRKMIGWPAPTWPEAVAHCAPDVQRHWLTHLRGLGVDLDAGGLRPRKAV